MITGRWNFGFSKYKTIIIIKNYPTIIVRIQWMRKEPYQWYSDWHGFLSIGPLPMKSIWADGENSALPDDPTHPPPPRLMPKISPLEIFQLCHNGVVCKVADQVSEEFNSSVIWVSKCIPRTISKSNPKTFRCLENNPGVPQSPSHPILPVFYRAKSQFTIELPKCFKTWSADLQTTILVFSMTKLSHRISVIFSVRSGMRERVSEYRIALNFLYPLI